jgi:hypothetical protein
MQSDYQLGLIEDRHFSKMLDSYDTSLTEGEKLKGYISDVADEYIVDGSHLEEIMECDMTAFFDKLAFVLAAKREDRDDALYEFKDWLIDRAKGMNNVQLEAASRFQQDSFYSDGE